MKGESFFTGVSWPLMQLWQVLLAIFVYLCVVLYLGPRFMANRQPMKLRRTLIVYNLVQVLLNAHLFITVIRENVFDLIFQLPCPQVKATLAGYVIGWWYLLIKYTELLDTVFFILRKKENQVTPLHVYHHASIIFVAWGSYYFVPGDPRVFVAMFLNTCVHVVMYSYYLIAALGPQYQKYLWWKKYMTQMQLLQFVMIISYIFVTFAIGCDLPMSMTLFYFGYITCFVILFFQFYRKSYKKVTKD